jgi:hypothetical protein
MGWTLKMNSRARAILREPLVHFLIAGFFVFLLSAWRGEAADPESRRITITEAQVARLSANWEMTWRRPPQPQEIDALIRDYVKEEVYYREAKRLGLDEDDTVIRRRLRSKMEYLASAQVENAQADDTMLQAWIDKYPARFARDVTYSFDQIYLGDSRRDQAAAILTALEAERVDWAAQSEPISLPKSLETTPRGEVERQFGPVFANSIAKLPSDIWSGPVESGFGMHLVRVRQRQIPQKPKLADVRQAVENDWRLATVKQREAKAYQALLDGYIIQISKP